MAAAADRLLRGDSIRSVCMWLTSEGHLTRKGAAWQRTTLRGTMLSEPSRLHVFDSATYRALETRLKPKRSGLPVPRGGRPNKWLLAGGLGKCGTCGQSLTTAGGGKSGALARYTCVGASKGQCKPRDKDGQGGSATIQAKALDERIEREFLEHYGDKHGLELRVTAEGPAGLDEAEQAEEAAQEALRQELTEENFRRAQAARERLDALRAQPVVRKREIWPTDKTYGEMWAAADVPERSRLLSQALAGPVIIRPGKPMNKPSGRGKMPNVERAQIVWRDEINPDEVS
jgi:site-specific DNA recombinase